MKFKEYIEEHELSYSTVGKAIKVSTESARRYANGERIPEPGTMREIVKFTRGAVTPNDFYNVPNQAPQ